MMTSNPYSMTVTTDPAYPWSLAGIGLPALALVALLLAGMTIWTYLGVAGASRRRVAVVLALRLAALILAVLAVLRPSLAARDDLRVPSVLLVALDGSESMAIGDEIGNASRWARMQSVLKNCEKDLQKLRDDHNVNVVLFRFAGDVNDYDPKQPPDGPRTDTGQMLNALLERYRGERFLRGLVVVSDGADNGTRFQPLSLAAQWRNLPCPLHTFAVGKTTTTERQSDLALVGLNPEPQPVFIKGELTLRVTLDAPGFENKAFHPRVFFEGKEEEAKVYQDDRLLPGDPVARLTVGNEFLLKCTAPDTPGEIKVTVKVDTQTGETNVKNNEISTYVTVVKEGVSVLLVETLGRQPEPQMLARSLAKNPRVRLYVAWMGAGEQAAPPGQADLLRFDQQRYDVIIVGDVTPGQLASGNPKAFATIKDLVARGTGLLFLGGLHAYGNSAWGTTDLAALMPVTLDAAGQIDRPTKVAPIESKLDQFMMRLADGREENKKTWEGLHELAHITRMGTPRRGATVLAESTGDKEPILVWNQFNEGRVMAFAGDSTYRWVRDEKGLAAYTRFWDQMILWLARQEEGESNVKVRLRSRRVAAGDPLDFTDLNLVDKGGVPVADARFEVTVKAPDNVDTKIPTARDKDGDKGTIWKTTSVGEYQIAITAKGTDASGNAITGSLPKPARFLVYQDDAEQARRAADHEFLKKLAAAGGGEFHRLEELATYLQKLQSEPLAQARPRPNFYPDWRRGQLSAFLPLFLVAFVAVLTMEWFLRRRWGLV